jgi:CRISPR-associated protein Cas1
MRDKLYDLSIMPRIASDIKTLLGFSSDDGGDFAEVDHVGLWDDKVGEVSAGRAYGVTEGEDPSDDLDAGVGEAAE